jgi:predicted N-acyltransferase
LRVAIHAQIAEVDATAWNRLVEANHPFLKHQFLHALEQQRCVGESMGWIPRHITLWEGAQLVGAMPLYEKHNGYGEFVFDHAWSDAYHRLGRDYYPKLVSAIPYTPVVGQRLLARSERHRKQLLQAARQLAETERFSGLHLLFATAEEGQWMAQQSLLQRHDCHFHWHNRGYRSFDDFLQALKSKKRKNIRQERRRVAEAGVTIRQLDGSTATRQDWVDFDRFYQRTFLSKGGMPTLNLDFFLQIAETLPEQVLLFLADRDGACVAGSLMFRSDSALYGRHWGCDEEIDALHFEACYYQGIEYAITHQLQWFEPGAQGEHKIPRGFVPIETRSSHWLREQFLQEPIRRFCEEEREFVEEYRIEKRAHQPYREEEA